MVLKVGVRLQTRTFGFVDLYLIGSVMHDCRASAVKRVLCLIVLWLLGAPSHAANITPVIRRSSHWRTRARPRRFPESACARTCAAA